MQTGHYAVRPHTLHTAADNVSDMQQNKEEKIQTHAGTSVILNGNSDASAALTLLLYSSLVVLHTLSSPK